MLYQHSIGFITLTKIWSGDNLEIMGRVRKLVKRALVHEDLLKIQFNPFLAHLPILYPQKTWFSGFLLFSGSIK